MHTKTIDGVKYHIHENRQPRELLSLAELEHSVIGEYFAHLDINGDDIYTPRFFKYRGWWYDSHEFEAARSQLGVNSHVLALGYNAFQTDSYWSATVISYFDSEGYELDGALIVGRIHW